MNIIKNSIVVAFVFLAVIAVRNVNAEPPVMYMINVNKDGFKHGDAYLIRSSGEIAMVDVANYESAKELMVPFLNKLGISVIDKLFITHPHTDHYGGIRALVESGVMVKKLYHSPLPEHVFDWNYKRAEYFTDIKLLVDRGTEIVVLSRGDAIRLGETTFNVIYAEKAESYDGREIIVNDYSSLITWQANGSRVMFTGDMEETLAKRLPDYLDLRADIVHMQHHGGHNVGDLEFYRKVNASVHLYSSTNQIFDVISGDARAITRKLNSELCHSAQNGTVKVTFLGGKYNIESESGGCSRSISSKKYGEIIHRNLANQFGKNVAFMAAIVQLLNE